VGDLDFHDWLDYGRRQGWIGDAFCLTHDTGLTDDELEEEHCVPGLRVTIALDEPEFVTGF
jgi:hypothetical protein